MELRLYVQMLIRSWWIVVLTALAALTIALLAVYFATPVYEATASFVVSPNLVSTDESDLLRGLDVLDKRSVLVTYAEILNSQRIYQATIAEEQFAARNMSAYETSTVVLPEANVLELTVRGTNPDVVAALANGLGEQAIDYISFLYTTFEVNFIDTASVPTQAISPRPVRDMSLAFALGLLFGAVLAIIREQLRTPLEAFLLRTHIDGESGAYNRRHFEDRLEDLTILSSENLVSMGIVRLDGLMSYLQLLPQPLLQQVMKRITEIMRQELRGNDIIGRWDNNAFSVLLPDTPGPAAVATLGRVQIALSKPLRYSPDGETMMLTPKIGISERVAGEPARVLIERTETALAESDREESGLVLYRTRALVGF